ncbi:MAG: exodeoxyribonuclease VII large subunit [Bacteroidia bacterium]|nr:exodeoxyribonuclease VII large subunit [Bacteroidia bacterium]
MIMEKLSLTELQLIIKDSLYMALPDFYWVIAEISEIKENSAGHCYLELIEKQADEKNVSARVKAIIWINRYRFLSAFFQDATGESLKDGMKILVKIKVEYHELYGLSLVISDIDPSFTLGEMAMKRQMIIRRLEEEGVFSMNRELDFPLLPQKIAVISSEGAAGYRDFISHLKGNNNKYVFYAALFETVMQGAETENSVISSLNRIADHPGLFDVVVIIRGGGSQSDLSWFDSYNIAFHVTQFPIPVITGIGHEKDMSVTDMVANQALKTPTAVADHLIERTANAEAALNDMIEGIDNITRSAIEDNRSLTDSFKLKVISAAGSNIAGRKVQVEKYSTDLRKSAMNLLEKVKTKTTVLENTLGILDPKNVLKRGYSITTLNGKLVKSAGDVKNEDVIETQIRDGKIRSKVLKK